VLYEEEKENRMQESLKVFDTICKNQYFAQVPIILFFNKVCAGVRGYISG